MDGEDGNGLKLEKTGQFFFKFGDDRRRKSPKLYKNSFLCNKYISHVVSGLLGMLYV